MEVEIVEKEEGLPVFDTDILNTLFWPTAEITTGLMGKINADLPLFRQNTYLQNKKHMLTCQGGTGCYRFNYQPGS